MVGGKRWVIARGYEYTKAAEFTNNPGSSREGELAGTNRGATEGVWGGASMFEKGQGHGSRCEVQICRGIPRGVHARIRLTSRI
jgi:hypothetical protein